MKTLLAILLSCGILLCFFFPLTQILKAVLYAFALILALIALYVLLQTLLMMWQDHRDQKEEDSDTASALDENIQFEDSDIKLKKKEKKKAKKAQKEESSNDFFYYDRTRKERKDGTIAYQTTFNLGDLLTIDCELSDDKKAKKKNNTGKKKKKKEKNSFKSKKKSLPLYMSEEIYKNPGQLKELYKDQYHEQKKRLNNHLALLHDLIESTFEGSPATMANYEKTLETTQSAFSRNSEYVQTQIDLFEKTSLSAINHEMIQKRLEKNEQIIGKLVLLINELGSLNSGNEDVLLLLDSLISQTDYYLKEKEEDSAKNDKNDELSSALE